MFSHLGLFPTESSLFNFFFFCIFHLAAGAKEQVPEQGRGGGSWVCFPWNSQDLSCAGTWLWHSLMHKVQTARAVQCREGDKAGTGAFLTLAASRALSPRNSAANSSPEAGAAPSHHSRDWHCSSSLSAVGEARQGAGVGF